MIKILPNHFEKVQRIPDLGGQSLKAFLRGIFRTADRDQLDQEGIPRDFPKQLRINFFAKREEVAATVFGEPEVEGILFRALEGARNDAGNKSFLLLDPVAIQFLTGFFLAIKLERKLFRFRKIHRCQTVRLKVLDLICGPAAVCRIEPLHFIRGQRNHIAGNRTRNNVRGVIVLVQPLGKFVQFVLFVVISDRMVGILALFSFKRFIERAA